MAVQLGTDPEQWKGCYPEKNQWETKKCLLIIHEGCVAKYVHNNYYNYYVVFYV